MRVGFIGLGTMGGSMALNARKGGHDLVVHDLREGVAAPHLEAGCRWADSPESGGARVGDRAHVAARPARGRGRRAKGS